MKSESLSVGVFKKLPGALWVGNPWAKIKPNSNAKPFSACYFFCSLSLEHAIPFSSLYMFLITFRTSFRYSFPVSVLWFKCKIMFPILCGVLCTPTFCVSIGIYWQVKFIKIFFNCFFCVFCSPNQWRSFLWKRLDVLFFVHSTVPLHCFWLPWALNKWLWPTDSFLISWLLPPVCFGIHSCGISTWIIELLSWLSNSKF